MEQLCIQDALIRPRAAGCPVPLTALQLRWWKSFVSQGERSEWRMCAGSVRISGALNTCNLQTSMEIVLQRHESLRTRIVPVNGVPRQRIDPAGTAAMTTIDLSTLPMISAEREATRLGQEFIEERIDLSVGPLFAAKLFRLSDREHVLILGLDHIVSDLASYGILKREIWTLYNQAAHGQSLSLPPLPVQFADYAVWEELTYDSWLRRHGAYWKQRLAGVSPLDFPPDSNSGKATHATGATLHFPFGKALTTGLGELARRERIQLPVVVLAAYAALVSRWFDRRDFVLGFFSHGRHGREELEAMIGLLVNYLHLRIEVTPQESFADLLRRVSLEVRAAQEHQDFNRVPDLIPECKTELSFNWLSTRRTASNIAYQREANFSIKTRQFALKTAWPIHKLLPLFADTPAGICMTIMYRSDLFAPSTIHRFARNLGSFLEELARAPRAPIASVAINS